jgi:hypothetical protein
MYSHQESSIKNMKELTNAEKASNKSKALEADMQSFMQSKDEQVNYIFYINCKFYFFKYKLKFY